MNRVTTGNSTKRWTGCMLYTHNTAQDNGSDMSPYRWPKIPDEKRYGIMEPPETVSAGIRSQISTSLPYRSALNGANRTCYAGKHNCGSTCRRITHRSLVLTLASKRYIRQESTFRHHPALSQSKRLENLRIVLKLHFSTWQGNSTFALFLAGRRDEFNS